jgi:hypothetical protein
MLTEKQILKIRSLSAGQKEDLFLAQIATCEHVLHTLLDCIFIMKEIESINGKSGDGVNALLKNYIQVIESSLNISHG